MESKRTNGKRTQVLTFRLGNEIFAIEVGKAREVLDFQEPTEVPQMPAEMLGVINLRGRVVPVVDLRRKFGLRDAERTRDNCIIILEALVEGEKVIVGAVADSVREVLDLSDEQIDPPPKMGTRLNPDFIRGMGKRGEEFILILDADRVFACGEINLDQAAGE